MDFLGETTLSLHPASALYVQPDSLGAPFKVANFAPPAGTINQDRSTGITGFFGAAPDGATITSDVSYAGRNRVGSSTVTVSQAWAQVAFFQQLANHDRVVDAIRKGSENQTWTIKGSQGGTPFTFTHSDRFTSSFDISFDASFELADLVYLLSTVEGVDVDSIAVDGDVTNGARDVLGGAATSSWSRASGSKVNNRNPAHRPGGQEAQAAGRAAAAATARRRGCRTRSRSRSGRRASRGHRST